MTITSWWAGGRLAEPVMAEKGLECFLGVEEDHEALPLGAMVMVMKW